MGGHVCPWWGGYFIDNRFRRLLHQPAQILAPYIQAGMTAMDFGCGMGFCAIPLAGMVGDNGCVIAVDLQQRMLDVLAKRAQRAGVADRIRTHCCERDSIGIHESIDFILAFWSAHEAPDLRRLLEELHACLASDGKFLLVEPKGHISAARFERMLAVAEEVGLVLDDEPRVGMSRAATFTRA